jgi:hypothetical protein
MARSSIALASLLALGITAGGGAHAADFAVTAQREECGK